MTISRDFKGIWIPAEIWLDRSLSYFEKALLAEIHSLEGETGCFASNKYLAEFFNEGERKIKAGISLLKARGYLAVKSFDGRTRVLVTSLNPKHDKSLFITPGGQDQKLYKHFLTPPRCSNPHPSHYIDNKEENTTTKPPPQNESTSKHSEMVVVDSLREDKAEHESQKEQPRSSKPKDDPQKLCREDVEAIKLYADQCSKAELPFNRLTLLKLAAKNYKLLREIVKDYWLRSPPEREKIKNPNGWLVDKFNELKDLDHLFI